MEELQEHPIKCIYCHAHILNWIHKNKTGTKKNIISVYCPYCSDGVTTVTVMGDIAYGPSAREQCKTPTNIGDLDYDRTTNKLTIKLTKA